MNTDRVAIIGAAAAPVGIYARPRPGDRVTSEAELLSEIAIQAMGDAGVRAKDIETAVFTAMLPNSTQQGFAVHMASRLGLRCTGQLGEVLQMGITGGLAFDQAAGDILLGRAQYALALGVACTSAGDPDATMELGLRVVGDAEFHAPFGVTPIAWYGLDAARYLHETGASRADLATVAVKSRDFARDNPLAQFRSSLTLEQVLDARPIVEPLGLFDVSAIADGAVCLVLTSEATARRRGGPFVTIKGRGFCHDGYHSVGSPTHDMTRYPALKNAADAALREADVTLGDMDVAELYAPCTITEVLATETLGWFSHGKGAAAAARGDTSLLGQIPINTSGGCLSRGHPPALSGLYGLVELRDQLLGEAGARQVDGARLAMASCEGGNYNVAIVHVLESPS